MWTFKKAINIWYVTNLIPASKNIGNFSISWPDTLEFISPKIISAVHGVKLATKYE
jgi:hypothetical protein